MQQPYVIGITGGIGSGKSTIAKVFSVLGYPVYDSDQRAKDIYLEPEVKAKAVALLGAQAYQADGTLNRRYVAEKVFNDKALLEKINELIHPAVMKDFESWKKKNSGCLFAVKESALLFETGLYRNSFKNILVTAPVETRVERVMQRDGLTREEVLKKIQSQWSDEDKKKLADFVLDNGGEELVIPKIVAWVEQLKLQVRS